MLSQVNDEGGRVGGGAGGRTDRLGERDHARPGARARRGGDREGWSNDQLADALLGDDAFSGARAEMIARTETAMADVQGNLIGWKESGVVEGKEWKVAQDGECDECAALDGEWSASTRSSPTAIRRCTRTAAATCCRCSPTMPNSAEPVAPGVWRRKRATAIARKLCGMTWPTFLRLRRLH
jgi:hypothetical protein